MKKLDDDVIPEFRFEVTYVRPDEIWFCNEKCIIRLIFDMGRVLCDFISPEEKKTKESLIRKDNMPSGIPVYSSYSVWKFLYPHDKLNFSYDGWDIDGQVSAIKRLLLERLTPIMKGNFSWTNDFKANNSRLSGKIEYMMTHWEMDNPVRISFREGKPDWEIKFDEYKRFLDSLNGIE